MQTIPSEELGPAAAHVKRLGFGAPMPAIDISSGSSSDMSITNASIDLATATVPMDDDTNTYSKADIEISDECNDIEADISTPVVPRVYPPSKPHHGSGRQAEPLMRVRDELRKGVGR